MDATTFFKADSFRNFVGITLPGYTATWPVLFYIILKFEIDLNQFELLIIFIWTMISIGVGMILEDLGGEIELKLERKVIKDKNAIDYYWRRYLLYSKMEHSEEPRMMKYISSIVIRMKFELNMIIAIVFMIISQLIIQTTNYTAFENNCLFTIFISLFFLIIIYLIFESMTSIKVLHNCRKRLIDNFDYPNDIKNLSNDFISPKFNEYIK